MGQAQIVPSTGCITEVPQFLQALADLPNPLNCLHALFYSNERALKE